jgi:phosphonoacetaldehyde hydrolase
MRLKGVILDWAGTVVDFGSCAPVDAFCDVFAAAGVPITRAEAREPMGLAKRAHIEALLQIPRIRTAWETSRGCAPTSHDVDTLYVEFIPKQIAALQGRSDLIPGVREAVERMQARGLKVGTTTGYPRAMLDYLLSRAREQGFLPDFSACPEDVGLGRPRPFMCYLNAIHLAVHPLWAMVKIGDTVADIEEGRNAGMWTIGITRTGNQVGLTAEEWSTLDAPERDRRLAAARESLMRAQPHYIAESVAECDEIFAEIDSRLERGDRS